jgi:hypothetical protein
VPSSRRWRPRHERPSTDEFELAAGLSAYLPRRLQWTRRTASTRLLSRRHSNDRCGAGLRPRRSRGLSRVGWVASSPCCCSASCEHPPGRDRSGATSLRPTSCSSRTTSGCARSTSTRAQRPPCCGMPG